MTAPVGHSSVPKTDCAATLVIATQRFCMFGAEPDGHALQLHEAGK